MVRPAPYAQGQTLPFVQLAQDKVDLLESKNIVSHRRIAPACLSISLCSSDVIALILTGAPGVYASELPRHCRPIQGLTRGLGCLAHRSLEDPAGTARGTWITLLVSFLPEVWYALFAVVRLPLCHHGCPKGEKHWNALGPERKSAPELYEDLRRSENGGTLTKDAVDH